MKKRIALVLLLVAACSHAIEGMLAGNLTSVGSDTLGNLMALWGENFNRLYPGVNVQIQAAGSSTAPTALAAGAAQLGAMSRPMQTVERQLIEDSYGYPPLAVPVAMDALVGKAKDQLAIEGKDNQIASLRTQLEKNVAAQATESDARLNAEMELIGATTARDSLAAEVKELANQTSKATEEIATQVSQIQEATAGAVGAIRDIAATIEEVHTIAIGVAAAAEQQQTAAQEIARNVSEAARGTGEVTGSISEVQQAATHAGSAAAEVLAAAGELSRNSATLGSEVESFLQGVRAA